MFTISHVNNGKCPKCAKIFDVYPGFHLGLRQWFERLQVGAPDAHVSNAGRGCADQTKFFNSKASKARWGQSAHNYNAAVDIFRLTQSGASYDAPWFRAVVGGAVAAWNSRPDQVFNLNWYGAPGSPFHELPHVEVANWRSNPAFILVERATAQSVEEVSFRKAVSVSKAAA